MKSQTNDGRISSEREFHNQRFGGEHDSREHLNKWYSAIAKGIRIQEAMVRKLAREKVVLEYGSADGELSLHLLGLPKIAREIHGIDISDKAVEKANDSARKDGVSSNSFFTAMNAEQMTFSDNAFDLVFGRGIIHHLDLNRAFSEIHRVLKPGGRALFLEPMGHNPLINWYRARTPEMRTPDEHPMLTPDFDLARQIFGRIETSFYGLTTIVAVPLQKMPASRYFALLMEGLDSMLFRIPLFQKYAWFTLLTLYKKP